MRDRNYTDASLFLAQFFGPTTTQNVEIRALPNQRGGGRAAPLFTRDPLDIEIHLKRWDEPLRAVFFGMATRLLGHGSGRREDLAELAGFWSDIDCNKLGLEKPLVAHTLRSDLYMPPTVTVDSGYGIHGYWLFREALDIRVKLEGAANLEANILAALKQLAGVTAGDVAVCDLARVMRLPGTHNTKLDQMVPCAVLEGSWTRYEYRELVEWLDWQRPVLQPPRAASGDRKKGAQRAAESDAFARYAATAGIKPPIDVGARLAAMEYLGAGNSSIHQTQLHCSASLVTHGADEEAIVALLMAATHEAVGVDGQHWNWQREEMNVRQMIRTARAKFESSPMSSENHGVSASPSYSENPTRRASPPTCENHAVGASQITSESPTTCASPAASENPNTCASLVQCENPTVSASPPICENPIDRASPGERENLTGCASPAESENPTSSAPAARVINLAQEREAGRRPRGRPRKDDPAGANARQVKTSLIAKTGDAVIAWWTDTRGRIATIEARPHTYGSGIWELWDEADYHCLKCAIQGVLRAGQIDPRTQLLNAVYRYVLEHPDLQIEGILWDATGCIVCQDAVLMPRGDGGWDTVSHSPDHWATKRVEVEISDMGQGCPRWLEFLDGCFSDRDPEEKAAVIACLQEWFGAAMVSRKPRELRKALWLHGESRAGKTRILEVLRTLIGEPTSSMKLKSLNTQFGPATLIGKRGWIADDAVGSNDEVDDAAFKCVVTGEAFSTDVKKSAYATMRLDVPVAFSSNALPRVRDQSDGVFNRSILIPMHVVRSEEETAGKPMIEDVVRASELAGVFAWGLEGWARLIERGRFMPPASMREAGEAFKAANNPGMAWAKDALVHDAFYMIDRRDLYESFKGWHIAEYGEQSKVPSPKYLIHALRDGMGIDQTKTKNGYPQQLGIKMTEVGLAFREGCPRGYSDKIGSGCVPSEVNKLWPK